MSIWKSLLGSFRFSEAASGTTIDQDEDKWRKLSEDPTRDLSPLSQARMRETAAYLWDSNLLANRIVELQNAYLLAEGVQLQASEKELQPAIDAFWNDPINQMDLKLPDKCRELSIMGEQCYPVFVNEVSGHVRLGYLDPGLIGEVVMDPDNPEQPIGVITVRDKRGQYRKFRVLVNGPDEELFSERTQVIRAGFQDGNCFLFQINKLVINRRGRSDLRAPADWVDAYDSFLFGELDRYTFLRAFVWDVTLKGANEAAVKTRASQISTPRPGSVRVHNESEIWNAVAPDVKSGDSAEGARLIRNHVLGGATIPEHWFGGGGDVNRAVGAEMGEPTFKVFSMRQRFIKHMLQSIGAFVIRSYLEARESSPIDFSDPRLRCEAIFPELTSKDTTKYASALQQVAAACVGLLQEGLITRSYAVSLVAAIAGRLGVECNPEQLLKDATTEKAKSREDDVFPAPSDPGLPGGTDLPASA